MPRDLHVYLPSAPVLKCDNISALALSTNLIFHSRIKHLDTDFHFVREKVQKGDLLVQYVSTKEQMADILTKGLHSHVFFFSIVLILTLELQVKLKGGNSYSSQKCQVAIICGDRCHCTRGSLQSKLSGY